VLARVVAVAREHRLTRGRRLRLDTTVVEAAIRHPTDSGLCADAVRVVSRARDAWGRRASRCRRACAMCGVACGGACTRSGKRSGGGVTRRRPRSSGPTADCCGFTGRLVRQAAATAAAVPRQLGTLPVVPQRAAARALAVLETMLPRVRQVLAQTRARLPRGETTSAGKLVSLFEPTAQILRRGKQHRPTEFGRLVRSMRPRAAS
jgi:IS5 family transposase